MKHDGNWMIVVEDVNSLLGKLRLYSPERRQIYAHADDLVPRPDGLDEAAWPDDYPIRLRVV
jgi:hypothetical protein